MLAILIKRVLASEMQATYVLERERKTESESERERDNRSERDNGSERASNNRNPLLAKLFRVR